MPHSKKHMWLFVGLAFFFLAKGVWFVMMGRDECEKVADDDFSSLSEVAQIQCEGLQIGGGVYAMAAVLAFLGAVKSTADTSDHPKI